MDIIDIDRLLDIGISLSSEKDSSKLLEMVLDAAMEITLCDAGTLYVLEDEMLHFKYAFTKSLGIRQGTGEEKVTLPPVPLAAPNVCSHAARTGKSSNIADVYRCKEHNFSGPKEYDKKTGYKTTSMLVVPMENDKGDIIGVLQLINALNAGGDIIPFNKKYEKAVFSLASQAATCLTIRNYAAEVLELLDSLVRVMATAIDARTPYNANHTRNMVRYAERFIEFLNSTGEEHFDEEQKREFLMSVWLHDVGKLVIPLEVMDKQGALTDEERKIMEGHVTMTRRMLGEISFPKQFKYVPDWASMHHEKLSGTGYPEGLAGDELPREVRILTILDIFDALTAHDRPYKSPMTDEKALAILTEMADNGEIDKRLLKLFTACRAWIAK